MKLSKRIKAAIKAFKEGPAPTLFLGAPPYLKEELNLRKICASARLYTFDYFGPVAPMEEAAKREIAVEIGRQLLKSGYIQFTYHEQERTLVGKVRVLAPKEAANT